MRGFISIDHYPARLNCIQILEERKDTGNWGKKKKTQTRREEKVNYMENNKQISAECRLYEEKRMGFRTLVKKFSPNW